MSSLRFLRGLALAVAGSALAVGAWTLPTEANAGLPQAPGPQPTLTVAAQVQGGSLTISGSLSAAGVPIDKASIAISLDGRNIGKTSTAADGTYSTSTKLPDPGTHVVTATFSGDKAFAGTQATTQFTYAPPPSTPPTTKAPATTAPPPTTTISATLTPNPVPAGGVLGVTGTVTSGGTPVDLSSLDITCDFGNLHTLGVTDSAGNFSVSLTLPPTGQPPSLTVTVSFAGDARFPAAKASFQSAVSAPSPSTAPTPTISASASAPPAPSVSTKPSDGTTGAPAPRGASTPAATFGIVFGIVGATSVAALGVLWVMARRRHHLLPGERRGFGSDFGHSSRSA